MAEARARERLSVAGAELAPRTGFRVRPQRPGRALFGVLLVVASVVVALTIYARVGDRHEVLAVTRTVLAGEQLSASDLRVVSISSDDSLPSVPSSAMDSMVGQYARNTPWSEFAAFAILFALPVSLVFFFFQRYLVGGLAGGGVKG